MVVVGIASSARAGGHKRVKNRSGLRMCIPVLIGEVTKHIDIDRIVAKRLRVLLQTDPAELTVNVQVQSPGSCQRQFLKNG